MKGKINLEMDLGGNSKKELGSITKKKGSNKLYVDFYYFGHRITKSTCRDDTEKNRIFVRDWLDNVHRKIDNGSFVFEEAFPGVSDAEKEMFAKYEGRIYTKNPQDVLFGDYANDWKKRFLNNMTSDSKKRDYTQVLDYWLLPKFKKFTFYELNGVVLKEFVLNDLIHKKGKKEGQALSDSRINNILIPLRVIYNDACAEHRWMLPNPFEYLRNAKVLKKPGNAAPEGLRFEQYEKIIACIQPYYVDHTNMMFQTGLIGSELAGLKESHIRDNEIMIRNSIVRNNEKTDLKTVFRKREIPITEALRKILDRAIARANGGYLFTMKSGRTFDVDSYRKNVWTPALKEAGVPYARPYVIRHTYAGWALVVGIDKNKLVSLMGHGSKKMVFEVYGKYVKYIEKDRDKILEFFGSDFLG